MAGLSLKVLLELQKKGFERNIASVKSGLKSLKKTVMGIASAFVGGLGLNQLIGHFTQTAKELSQVEATLRNVSDSYLDYSKNLEFLRGVAQQYGQEQNALIGSFAKFSSAAKGAGMELAQQQNIFRSLTKAAGAFHLTADETASVMLAVEQMISKGVVASEELRRQLSNVLPGSFQAMANAAKEAGITATSSQQALMDAMKQGRVVAADVLPYFAKELDKMTANASFDSLVSSVNRLSNAWTQFVKNSQFTGLYQGMVNGLAGALDIMGRNFKSFVNNILVLGGSIAGALGLKKFAKSNNIYLDFLKAKLDESRGSFDKLLGQASALDKLLGMFETGKIEELTFDFTHAEAEAAKLSKEMRTLAFDNEQHGLKITKTILKSSDAQALLNYRIEKTREESVEAALAAGEFQNKVEKLEKNGGKVFIGLGNSLKKVVGFFKKIGPTVGITAVLAILGKITEKTIEWYKWRKKIKDLEENSVKNAKTLNADAQNEIDQAYAELQIYKDMADNVLGQQQSLDKINGLLGLSNDEMLKLGTSAEDVKQKIDSWAKAKEADTVASQLDEAIQKTATSVVELERKLSEIESNPAFGKTTRFADEAGKSTERLTFKAMLLEIQHRKVTRELKAQKKAYDDMVAAASSGDNKRHFIGPPPPASLGGPKTEAQTAVSNAIDEYNKKANELKNRYKNGILTSQQYQKELANEQYNVLQTIGVYENLEAIVDSLKGTYREAFNEIKKGAKKAGGGGTENPLLEAFKKFSEERKKIDNQLKNGFINEGEYSQKLLPLIEDLEEVVYAQDDVEKSVKGLDGSYWSLWQTIKAGKPGWKAVKTLYEEQQEAAEETKEANEEAAEGYKELTEALKEKPGTFNNNRDTTFDYKKSKSEIDKENLDIIEDFVRKWEDYIELLERVEEKYGDLGGAVTIALDEAKQGLSEAMDAAKDAKDAANLSEIIEDIDELKGQLFEGRLDAANSIVGGLESIISSIESCKDAWESLGDSENKGLDGLKAVLTTFSAIISTIETVKSAMMAFNAVTETISKLQEARQKKEAAGELAVAAATKISSSIKTKSSDKSVIANLAEAVAAKKAAKEEGKKAAAGAASSVASIPYIGHILAVGAIASVVGALLAGFSRFEKGGIVGGNSTTGDKNIIRANSREAVLTKHMQGNLLSILRDGGTGGQVEFKIKGSDLIGVQKNYDRRLRG